MAFRKTLARRFFSISSLRPATAAASACPCSRRRASDDAPPLLLRLLQRRPLFHAAVPPDRIAASAGSGVRVGSGPGAGLPTGEKLIERIRALRGCRINLDGILPPPALTELAPAPSDHSPSPAAARLTQTARETAEAPPVMTSAEVRKVLRAAQMESARSRLRAEPGSYVSKGDFYRICCEVSSEEQGPVIARALDESGAVIVLGEVVLIRPDQVAKVIQSVIPLSTTISPPSVEQSSELQGMEELKAVIDNKAEALVRKELWGGLAFMALQTAGFMRLTFCELSWDVMEPICFFVTSLYFMAGYAFFMRTSKDPSFEGFFQARFATKQKLLMKEYNFDPLRFNELRRACPPHPSEELNSHFSYCNCNRI